MIIKTTQLRSNILPTFYFALMLSFYLEAHHLPYFICPNIEPQSLHNRLYFQFKQIYSIKKTSVYFFKV